MRDNFRASMYQARRYFIFLFKFGAIQDIEQEIRLAILESKSDKDLARQVNKRLYHLARDLGFRKRHINEGRDEYGNWWERKIISLNEYGEYKQGREF